MNNILKNFIIIIYLIFILYLKYITIITKNHIFMDSKSLNGENLILIGAITSAHGIKGQVLAKLFNQYPLEITNMNIVNNDGEVLKITNVKKHISKDLYVLTIKKVNNRSLAEQLAKNLLYCKASELESLQDDEFYYEDLREKCVRYNDQEVGKVIAMHDFGAGDIIEIECNLSLIDGAFSNSKSNPIRKIMIPFSEKYVPLITKDYITISDAIIDFV